MAENEFNILRKLDHPNIIHVIEAYKDDNHFALVTEFCKGEDFNTEILSWKKLPEK